jgi:pimeloyl-ACP methyl ester carboxylesterase
MNLVSKKTGSFKSYDGTKIYYEVRGEGRPLVMAYGIGCLINHWQPQIKYFSQKYQTVVFDYRGHHSSELPLDHSQISIDALARDVNALADHLNLTSASYWGHSFGAQVLLRAYDMRPSTFHNLVFVNGFASDPISGMFGNGMASQAFNLIKSGFDIAPTTFSYLWKQIVNNPLSVHSSALLGGFNIQLTALKDIEIYLKGVAAMDLNAFLKLFDNMMKYDGRPVYDRIEVPTLIVGGKKDAVTPQRYQQEMHLRIKKSEFMMVPFGSHCTQLDMPDLVNLRIEKFLKGLDYA